MKSTVDPGGIPNASCTIGGPKHLELSQWMSVDHPGQCGALSHKAEGSLSSETRLTHIRLCFNPVDELG